MSLMYLSPLTSLNVNSLWLCNSLTSHCSLQTTEVFTWGSLSTFIICLLAQKGQTLLYMHTNTNVDA